MSGRTHEEITELLGVYALNAVDAEERAAVEAHLETCPRCRAEVADHREVAALLASTGGTAPDHVWDRISASLDDDAPDVELPLRSPGGRVVSLRPARRTVSARALTALAAAAVVVIAALGAGIVRQGSRIDELSEERTLEQAAIAAMADPDARTVRLTSSDGSRTASAAILEDGRGFLVASELPTLDGDRTYQLWGVNGDVVFSLGVLGASFEVVPFMADGPLDALAITEEVAGGVAQSQNAPALSGTI